MNLPAKIKGLEAADLPDQELHLAIGMFDGVHRGHQSVIGKALEGARAAGGLAGVLTFWPHPSALFRPEDPVPQIMEPAVKEKVIFRLGIDLVIEQPFTSDFAALPAEDFLAYLTRKLPRLRAVYVGENWRFGQGRKGDAALLIELGRKLGIRVTAVPRLQASGEAISSTRIRTCLSKGEIAEANDLLGFAYFNEGVVQEGKKLGRTLDFPTLNLPWNPQLKPRFGVYVVRVTEVGEESAPSFTGVANYGVRPTVDATKEEPEPLLEIFLLGDTCPFSTGSHLRAEWLTFLRPEQRFPSLEALKAQIARDITTAKQLT